MPNWSDADKDMVKHVAREAEMYLGGQVTLGTSADQRASVLGGVFMAAGTAIVAGLLGILSAGFMSWSIIVGGSISAILLLVASGLCILATVPVGFWLPGNEPKSWYEDVDSNRPLLEAMGEEAEQIQEKIEENRKELKKNARRFKWGAFLGVTAPFVGAVVYLLAMGCIGSP